VSREYQSYEEIEDSKRPDIYTTPGQKQLLLKKLGAENIDPKVDQSQRM
jgi:hypothetical protein